MAANYWSSTQRRFWTFTKQEMVEMRENLDQGDGNLSQQYPLPENRLLNIYFHQRKLGVCFLSRVCPKNNLQNSSSWVNA